MERFPPEMYGGVLFLKSRPDWHASDSVLPVGVDRVGRIARHSVRVFRHGTPPPYLLSKTCVAPLTDRSVVVRRTASSEFAGGAGPYKAKIGRSCMGGARFFNA